jgi:hypothetical protein
MYEAGDTITVDGERFDLARPGAFRTTKALLGFCGVLVLVVGVAMFVTQHLWVMCVMIFVAGHLGGVAIAMALAGWDDR